MSPTTNQSDLPSVVSSGASDSGFEMIVAVEVSPSRRARRLAHASYVDAAVGPFCVDQSFGTPLIS